MYFCFFGTHKSSTKSKSLKCHCQCNHIRHKPKLVYPPKQLTLVSDKCKEPEEIVLGKSISCSNGILSELVA
ncbi:unnamed protein product [Hymenolepis diminuta]|uniref:Uncharacterized protein n=1 Tax=Hymenolepis diminuta TaxID=6216 RepID=A0A564YW18_HYMDI|nr:unnamed protein product [Hymenolepis diminuta]